MTNEQERIVLENENLIYMVLKKYHLYAKCEEFYDLGMIGLCKGARTYDSTRNIKLSTYLSKCIANEILQYLRKKRPETVSLDINLNVDEKLTLESVTKDESIDIERDLIKKADFERINNIIKSLPENERLIINYLFNINGYDKMTQMEVAEYFNLSQAQICRIRKKIISKIKSELRKDDIATGGN